MGQLEFYGTNGYGFLANSVRKKRLESIRLLLGGLQGIKRKLKSENLKNTLPTNQTLCPKCQQGEMHIIMYLKKIK